MFVVVRILNEIYITHGVFGFVLFKDSIFSLLWSGGSLEVSIVDMFWDGDARDVELGRSSNACRGGASSHWDTVDLEWTGNKEETRSQLLQENDTFTTEGTSEHDKNSSWSDA